LLNQAFAQTTAALRGGNFLIPNSTELKLYMPPGWAPNIASRSSALPLTISICQNETNDPSIRIAALWNKSNSDSFNDTQGIRETVIGIGKNYLSAADETT
jgi:hypothetical protein